MWFVGDVVELLPPDLVLFWLVKKKMAPKTIIIAARMPKKDLLIFSLKKVNQLLV